MRGCCLKGERLQSSSVRRRHLCEYCVTQSVKAKSAAMSMSAAVSSTVMLPAYEAKCLAGAPVQAKTFTFTLSGQNRDAKGIYRVKLPDAGLRNCIGLEVAGFETQAVELNISSEEDKVVWTEGLRMSTGEAPTVYGVISPSGAGVPVFDHEICIQETAADGTLAYFKVGLCPQLNEVSTTLWDSSNTGARVSTDLANSVDLDDTAAARYYFSTTRCSTGDAKWAAPHYLNALQELVGAGSLPDMRAYTACMAQLRHVDLTASTPLVFRSPSVAPPPAYGQTHFQVSSADAARAHFVGLTATASTPNISTAALVSGFLCCSAWHFPDIVTMLNHQLKTVTNSTADATAASNYRRCGTGGRLPSNTYEFQYTEGRFRFVCLAKNVDFVVLENVFGTAGVAAYRDIFHGNGTTYGGAAQAATRAAVPSAPTGSSARVTSLWRALGFRATAPGAFSRETTRGGGTLESVISEALYGMRAEEAPACVLTTTLPAAYYTPQSLADGLAFAMNGGRPKATVPSNTNQLAGACTFVDSQGVPHSLVLTAGCRTPHQYAAALEFLLNRTDTRGVLYSGHRHSYDETYAQFVPTGRVDGGGRQASSTVALARVWYTCTYDAVTGTFSVTNRELDGSLNLGNAATRYPATPGAAALQFASGTATSGGVRARFTLSFRASDLPSAVASLLTTTASASATTAIAAIYGFDAERWYEGTTVVSTRRSSCCAAHEQTLTRGQLNDAHTTDDSYCLRPLDDAVDTSVGSGVLAHNALDFRGSGPDNRVGARFNYAVTGSAQNDKQLTLHATQPVTPFSTDNAAIKSGDGNGTPSDTAYRNNKARVIVTVANKQVTGMLMATNTVDTRVGTIHVIADGEEGTATLANEAFFRVAETGAGGAISTTTLVFGGSGTGTLPYVNEATYPAYQLNANQDLRVIHGTPSAYTSGVTSTTRDASRIVVQAAATRESLSQDWRCMQQVLPFAPGDPVLLGIQQSVLLGAINRGLSANHYLTITQVSADGHLIEATATKPDETGIYAGHHYIAQQGNCRTVIRLLTIAATAYTFAVAQRGTGHEIVSNKKVWLFGPVVPYMVGIVEEVVQPQFRRRETARTEPESEFTSQWAPLYVDNATGVTVTTVTSLARDGSCLKIRLPLLAQYAQHDGNLRYCHPSNLMRIASLDLPRMQLLNSGPSVTLDYAREDTVWPSAGLVTDSQAACTVKLPNEWDLDATAGLLITCEGMCFEDNNVFIGPNGTIPNVIAQVTFGARVARAWSSLHAKRFTHKQLDTLRFGLYDVKGNMYNLRGRACRITLTLQYV